MYNDHIPFETDRLHIREFRSDDAPALAAMAMKDGCFTFYSLKPFADTSEADIRRNAEAIVAYAAQTRITALRDHFKLAVCLKPAPGETDAPLIGYVALDDAHDDDKRDIGYFTDPDHQRQGYATEAASGLLDRFFAATGQSRINLTVHPCNTPSRHVAARLGFRQIGETSLKVGGETQPRLKFVLDLG